MLIPRTLIAGSLLLFALPSYGELSREEFCQKLPEGNVCSEVQKDIWGEAPAKSVDTSNGVAIAALNGEKKVWENLGKQPWGTDHVYLYLGYVPSHQFFLIKGIHWGEEVKYHLVSYKDGTEYQLTGLPKFTPDGKHFLVIPEHFGALPNSGSIYRATAQGVKEIGSFKFKSDLSVKPLWVNPDALAIFEVVHSNRKDYSIKRLLMRVTHINGEWIPREEKYDV